MWGTQTRRAGLVALTLVPMLFAVPASATARTTGTKPITTAFKEGTQGPSVQDGVCPDAYLDGNPDEPFFEEYNQVFAADREVHLPHHQLGDERLGVSICWANSSALGGDEIDGGTFSYSTPDGTLRGTVSGSESFSFASPFELTLTIVSGTGTLGMTTGTIGYVGCQPDGPNMVSKLEINPRPRAPYPKLPAACAAPTSA